MFLQVSACTKFADVSLTKASHWPRLKSRWEVTTRRHESLVPITTKADNSFPPNSNYLCPFVVLEKTLKSPLDCKEIKPVNPKKKKINPQYALEELMVKLKLQYFGLLMWRADSLEKTPMLWKIKGKRRGQQKIRCLDSVTDSNGHESEQTSGDGEGQGSLAC